MWSTLDFLIFKVNNILGLKKALNDTLNKAHTMSSKTLQMFLVGHAVKGVR